jgi:hypothetical protein
MKFRLTILSSVAYVFLIGCMIYTLVQYPVLSEGEGWGVVYMIGLFLFGASALLVDMVIQKLFKNKSHQVIARIVTVIIYILLFFLGT